MAYSAVDRRDQRIDLLRGFAVFAMLVDHLAGPSALYGLTGGNHFFTSAAEGFVFISGLVVGLAYVGLARREGLGSALRRLLDRAWQLYVLAVGLTIVVLPLSEILGLPWAYGVDLSRPEALVWSILTLHQTYYLVDVPLLYALLLAVSPLAFVLLSEGRTWVLVALSWTAWAGYQIFPERTGFPWEIAGNNLFHLAAWQVLFFSGMAIGYHRQRLAGWLSPRARWPIFVLSGAAFALLILAYVNFDTLQAWLQSMTDTSSVAAGPSPTSDLEDMLFAKGSVQVGRVLASAAVFTFLFSVATVAWVPLRAALGWLLLPLGQNALYAYSAHIVVAVTTGLLSQTLESAVGASAGANAVLQIASIGLIWAAIRLRLLVPTAENRRYWMASVVPLAVAVLWVVRLDPSPDMPGLAPGPAHVSAAELRHNLAFGTPIPRDRLPSGLAPVPGGTMTAIASGLGFPAPPSELQPAPDGSAAPPQQIPYVGALQGALREMQFYSSALDRDMSYYAYLPPGYGQEHRRYPVLYLLHGGGAHKEEWLAYGVVDAADQMIVSKELKPFILILPQGDHGYWVNHANDGQRWGDYVVYDLVRQVDATFRTLSFASYRAIGGLSMGGAGALQLAFNNPDVFRTVGAHSPSIHLDDGTFPIYGTGAQFDRREPLALAQQAPDIESLDIWIDAGEQDPWLPRDQMLHDALVSRGIDHHWTVLPGGHDGRYWKRNVPSYLRYYQASLNWRGRD